MPKGPNGQKRPGDVVSAAIMVAKIATGEIEDNPLPSGKEYASRGGKKGGEIRARVLTAAERSSIAKKAAKTRWETNQAVRDEKEHS